jgi:glycosyltransferase involved in cell wall biosynthesis
VDRLRILVLINSGPADRPRAEALFRDLSRRHDVRFEHRDRARPVRTLLRLCRGAVRIAPHVVYIENLGYPCVAAAAVARRLHGSRVVVSTGDVVADFARSHFHPARARAMAAMEQAAHRLADVLVARGSREQVDLLRRTSVADVWWIPEGVDASRFTPMDTTDLRRRLGAHDRLTIGVTGSLRWNARRQFCYGLDVLRVLHALKGQPVHGVIVGGGDGLPRLRQAARELGVEECVTFTGWIDHADLPAYVNAIDVCLSTQSDDGVGRVRITAKLPEYLACGRYVVASDVGGASEFLRDVGCLVPPTSLAGPEYVERVADEVRRILRDRGVLARAAGGVRIARETFDYAVLRPRFEHGIEQLGRAPARRAGVAHSVEPVR